MNTRRKKQICLAATSTVFAGVLAVGLIFAFDEMAGVVFAAINGTIVIALVVDLFNRRGDSDRSNRPPNPTDRKFPRL